MKIINKRVETIVSTYLDSRVGKRYLISNDKSLKSVGFSLRFRPDKLYFVSKLNKYIVVEIDERQHTSYNIDKERVRMNLIEKDLQKSVVWIRFNPHGYRDKFKVPFNERLVVLRKTLKNSLNGTNNMNRQYLFYSKNNKHMV